MHTGVMRSLIQCFPQVLMRLFLALSAMAFWQAMEWNYIRSSASHRRCSCTHCSYVWRIRKQTRRDSIVVFSPVRRGVPSSGTYYIARVIILLSFFFNDIILLFEPALHVLIQHRSWQATRRRKHVCRSGRPQASCLYL